MKTNNQTTFSSNDTKLTSNAYGNNNKLADMTLIELQEIAIKQQQQIEINQQLLLAKEKRLKILKLEEQRNQQLTILSQNSLVNGSGQLINGQSCNNKTAENSNKLENLKQNVLGQELKIFKLKELRNQILKHKLSNSNMSSELDLIKSLFAKKERELCDAVKNVAELTKQIDQLRKIKTFSITGNTTTNNSSGSPFNQKSNQSSQNISASELEKLKQELQIRNKLNEQQSKKIMQQHESFNQKQCEVLALDKRIEELQKRISSKKILGEQLNQSFNNCQNIQKQVNKQQAQDFSGEEVENFNQHGHIHDETDENECRMNENNLNKYSNGSNNVGFSPSKQNAKFATKQEIANTYMNKFGSEAYQRYQINSLKVLQQQQRPNYNPNMMQTVNENQQMTLNTHNKQPSTDENESFNPNNLILPNQQATSPNQPSQSANNSNSKTRDFMNELQNNDPSTLPSHLTHEFDKIKYLPDMVKTIKKRHSISEIEGSSHHVPPLIFQKMIEKHHKNFLDQKQQVQLNQIKEQEQLSPVLNGVKLEEKSRSESPKTSTEAARVFEKYKENTVSPRADHVNSLKEKVPENESEQHVQTKPVTKSTKPIIKTGAALAANSEHGQKKRRVNFNPHALLLDAAVEGELDLVVKCAKLVKDVSEPNDEGITALHNSVCAGHFEIVKFLVEFGCDVNFADNDGWTPLHCAASCNNLPMVKFLIEHGASVYASTLSDNETAIKKCEEDEDGFEACYEYLCNAQENLGSTEYNNGVSYALYSYEAQNSDELSFKSDDKLIILNKNEDEENGDDCDGWWTATTIDSKEGLVPNNYLGLYPRVVPSKKNNQHESTIC